VSLDNALGNKQCRKSRRKFFTVDASVVVHMRSVLLVCDSQKQTKATCRPPWSTFDRCKRAMSESVQKHRWTRRFVYDPVRPQPVNVPNISNGVLT
jgi:hypothetical protein